MTHILRYSGIFVLIFLAALTWSGCDNSATETDQLELKRVAWVSGVRQFSVADLNGDGIVECIQFFENHYQLLPRRFSRKLYLGPAINDIRRQQYILCIETFDIDSLPGDEIVYMIKDTLHDSTWMEIGSLADTVRHCQTEAIRGRDLSAKRGTDDVGAWDGTIFRCFAADLDGDGIKEILALVMSGYDCYPRGLYVYDYPSGALRWKYLTPGPPYEDIHFGDADNDGRLEIYFRTWNPGNRCEVNGKTDTTAFLYAVDYDGSLRWSQCLGDNFDFKSSQIAVCDCDSDDTLEVYYTTLERADDPDYHIRILEKHRAHDNYQLGLKPFEPEYYYRDLVTADIDSDGRQEIILGGRPTVVSADSLNVRGAGTLSRYDVRYVGDIDDDDENGLETIMGRADSLIFLDRRLNAIGAYQTDHGENIEEVSVFRDPYGRILLAAIVSYADNAGRRHSLALFHIERAAFTGGKWLVTLIIGLAVFGAGLGIGFLMFYRKGVSGSARPAANIDSGYYDNLLSFLTSFGHGQMAGKNLNRLAFLFGNFPDDPAKLDQLKPNVSSAIDAYRSFTSPQLRNIIVSAMRLKDLRPVLKSLDSTTTALDKIITGLAPDIISVDSHIHLKTEIPELTAKIKDGTKAITEYVQHYYAGDLVAAVRSILRATYRHMAQQGVTLGGLNVSGDLNRPVFFAESELRTIIEELINNACRAMKETTEKTLAIEIAFVGGDVIMKVIDSGIGIDTARLDRLFDRDYSTKQKEGGYGLYHARTQVNRFGGQIRIYPNDGASGTTVEMKLKTLDHE